MFINKIIHYEVVAVLSASQILDKVKKDHTYGMGKYFCATVDDCISEVIGSLKWLSQQSQNQYFYVLEVDHVSQEAITE